MRSTAIVVGPVVLGLLSGCGDDQPRSQLSNGLQTLPVEAAAVELNRRLEQRFPSGLAEERLVDALEADGFRIASDDHLCSVPRCASFEWWPDRLGGVGYSVSWTVDHHGRVSRVQTEQVALLN